MENNGTQGNHLADEEEDHTDPLPVPVQDRITEEVYLQVREAMKELRNGDLSRLSYAAAKIEDRHYRDASAWGIKLKGPAHPLTEELNRRILALEVQSEIRERDKRYERMRKLESELNNKIEELVNEFTPKLIKRRKLIERWEVYSSIRRLLELHHRVIESTVDVHASNE